MKQWKPALSLIPVFGEKYKDTDWNFMWPQEQDLETWPLDRKIKLARINTAWTSMRSIQMHFTQNVSSPEYACNENEQSETDNQSAYIFRKEQVINTQGVPIKEIGVKLNANQMIYGLKFVYTTGDVLILHEAADGKNCGQWRFREVPAG